MVKILTNLTAKKGVVGLVAHGSFCT